MTRNRNKERARKEYIEKQKAKGRSKMKARKERVKLGLPTRQPHTLETLRIKDPTMVEGSDEEVEADEAQDEMSAVLSGEVTPKVLVTCTDTKVCPHTIKFCKELCEVIPNATFYSRYRSALKKLIPKAVEKGFTSVLVVNEDRKKANGLVLVNLPEGPTAHFKLSNMRLRKEVKLARGSGPIETSQSPQVLLNRFQTRLGRRVSRMLAALFPRPKDGVASVRSNRRSVTFHNQRDFIFFRHHRFEFRERASDGEKRAVLKEFGPRFTLKLRTLQNDTFDSKFGDFEFVHKRHEQETSRRKFFL